MTLPGGFSFVHPEALAILVLLPIWWVWRRRQQPGAIVFSRTGVLARGPRVGRLLARTIFVLQNLVIVGVVVALARPRSGAQVQDRSSEGINIMLVVDLSSSMLAQDFKPRNRLEVARERVKEFVNQRASDRIGLVAFAGEALTQVPLTNDHALVLQAIDNMQPGQLEDGTAIGAGIATGANRLRLAPGRSRVMVLLTDGVNNRGSVDPRTAAQAAGVFGVKIYSIGVGSEGMAPVPVSRDAFGLKYEMMPVEIDEALLTEISRKTGGQYFRARDAAALGRIYNEINRLERSQVKVKTYIQYSEMFRWPLALSMLALVSHVGLLAWRAPVP